MYRNAFYYIFFHFIPRPTFNGEPEVMKRLVSRYILQTKKQKQQDGTVLSIYELREDRKREVQKVASQMDNIKREVISTVRSISPVPSSPQGSFLSASNYYSNPGHVTSSGHGGLTRSDIQELKYELVSSLRTELRDAVQDVIQNSDNISNKMASNVSLPPLNSELYQTHLYTQL
ncbi:hypothetical protein KUTeg_024410 [Tegillarca granosa]|uniref:Uncharacterized protein n=1 Tax=Tegillarca granosa TaxID=220873 RepID=A0ABQ9DXT2_TEGGR|nr:hypothetical protein KUTeg_024410 [Tegillarca granosa]